MEEEKEKKPSLREQGNTIMNMMTIQQSRYWVYNANGLVALAQLGVPMCGKLTRMFLTEGASRESFFELLPAVVNSLSDEKTEVAPESRDEAVKELSEALVENPDSALASVAALILNVMYDIPLDMGVFQDAPPAELTPYISLVQAASSCKRPAEYIVAQFTEPVEKATALLKGKTASTETMAAIEKVLARRRVHDATTRELLTLLLFIVKYAQK